VVEIDGIPYLLERPLKADYAVLCGFKVDKAGNVWYKGTTRNFSVVMATAAANVIVEAVNLVEIGEIEPENVMTPGILVDYIVSE
jgi:acetate CoA/acetoacetate CoA-transferase alpha subunit